jgi:hypothetical protein
MSGQHGKPAGPYSSVEHGAQALAALGDRAGSAYHHERPIEAGHVQEHIARILTQDDSPGLALVRQATIDSNWQSAARQKTNNSVAFS